MTEASRANGHYEAVARFIRDDIENVLGVKLSDGVWRDVFNHAVTLAENATDLFMDPGDGTTSLGLARISLVAASQLVAQVAKDLSVNKPHGN